MDTRTIGRNLKKQNQNVMESDFKKTDSLIQTAAKAGHTALYEHEVYDLLAAAGIGAPPKYHLFRSPKESLTPLDQLASEKLVLKIVHPRIAHKTDVKGVCIVSHSDAGKEIARLFDETPAEQARLFIDQNEIPSELAGLSTDELSKRLHKEIVGVLAYDFVNDKPGFGHELLLGMRLTSEFGPVITMGLGGVDTELYSREFKRGRATLTVSPATCDDRQILEAFTETTSFAILTGRARGHEGVVTKEALADLTRRFQALVRHYSPLNAKATFWLTECEINPFLFSNGKPIPVDGLLRFCRAESPAPKPPVKKIKNLLQPKNVCVIGVSSKDVNVGRTILKNLLSGDFTPDTLAIVKEDEKEIDGVRCFATVRDLPRKYDLIVLSVAAQRVPQMISEIIQNEKAEAITLITGGMGEKAGAKNLEDEVRNILTASRARKDGGPVMVGGNSLGIISVPGGYDTMFIPPSKLPKNPHLPMSRNVALLSQSGAFMISRMNKMGGFVPRYAISTGNQVDLGIGDFLEFLETDDAINVFGCYVEGFKPAEGLAFAKTARRLIASGKDIIVYKVGRSDAGKKAASGHTAAIAGDWNVTEAILTQAGCMVAHSFGEWGNLLMLSSLLAGRSVGRGRMGAISNAGYETVGMADTCTLSFADLKPETHQRILGILQTFRLLTLQDIRNPMDLTPMAVDRVHTEVLRAFAADPNVDVLLHACVPLTPAMKTRAPGGPEGEGIATPESFTQFLVTAFKTEITKPLVAVIDSGNLYDPMATMLLEAGIPVFRSADEAMSTFGTWVKAHVQHHRPT